MKNTINSVIHPDGTIGCFVCIVMFIFIFLGVSGVYMRINMADNIQSVSAEEIDVQEKKKMIVIVFSATWCGPCQEMKRTTWNNPQLKKY